MSPRPSQKQHMVMHLADTLNIPPDTLIGSGNGILIAGMPGSGKTSLMALLLEQFGKFHIPGAIFDLEGDLLSLVDEVPHSVVATKEHCPTARDIYQHGLMVVYDLASWDTPEEQGILIAGVSAALMREAQSREYAKRVPCLVGLDEAAYWLPQFIKKSASAGISHETFRDLYSAFRNIATRGRKYGVVPLLCTQRFSSLSNDVLTPGTYMFMRQSFDTELTRYLEYINTSAITKGVTLTQRQVKAAIMDFGDGQAIVRLPGGAHQMVQFYKRASEHLSHAPQTQAALQLYAHKAPTQQHYHTSPADVPPAVNTEKPPRRKRAVAGGVSIVKGRLLEILRNDPKLSDYALAQACHCSVSDVKRWRTVLADEAIQAALERDSDLSPMELVQRIGCTLEHAKEVRARFFTPCIPPNRRATISHVSSLAPAGAS